MKVRIQHDGGCGWTDFCEREVTERGPRTVRVLDIDGREQTFSVKTGDVLRSVFWLRIHPGDVPALASLPQRLAKTKPMDLNAHPLADVLRKALTDAATLTVGGDGVDEIVREIIDEGYGIGLGCKDDVQLTRIAALALAGLAALGKQKGGAR